MFRSGLINTLVTHANKKGFGLTPLSLVKNRCGCGYNLIQNRNRNNLLCVDCVWLYALPWPFKRYQKSKIYDKDKPYNHTQSKNLKKRPHFLFWGWRLIFLGLNLPSSVIKLLREYDFMIKWLVLKFLKNKCPTKSTTNDLLY